ncbi:MAG: glycosyltransferase [Patescibacteria group bacterium]
MKKVLFVITKSNWGGAQRYVFDLATNLPKENWEAKAVLGGNGLLKQKLEESGIQTIQIPHLERDINFKKEITSFFSLIKIFIKERPNIIHLNSSKAGAIGAVAAIFSKMWLKLWTKNYGLKTIFTVHGWAFNEARTFRQKTGIYLSQWLTSFLCDNTIIISRHDYRQAMGMPLIKSGGFALIPLGIPENNLKYLSKKNAEKELVISPGEKGIRAGTIAEFTKNKGLDYLLDAINALKHPGLKLAIIGDGEEKARIEKRVLDENLQDRVKILGFVPQASKYIKAFDIFVLPSLKEGLPYTILEAMNAGVPIVASSVGGIPDLIEHEKSGILTIPANSESIKDALEKITASKQIRNKFARASRLRAKEKFPFNAMLSRTIDLYQ